MRPGTKVKISAAALNALSNGCAPGSHKGPIDSEFGCMKCSMEHLEEFKDCVGLVEGLVDFGNDYSGPELNVRWMPSNLRYGYLPEHLEIVE